MNVLQKTIGHLRTVNRHRREVRKNCFACGLYLQGLKHDLSKYGFTEFTESVRYYQGNRSPYTKEKELFGYAPGWLHHKGRNKHHWEYWYDMINGKWVPLDVPLPFVAEMLCDRVAACKIYEGEKYSCQSALAYYNSRNDKLYLHPHTRESLEKMLTMVAEKGERATFAAIKEEIAAYRKANKKR